MVARIKNIKNIKMTNEEANRQIDESAFYIALKRASYVGRSCIFIDDACRDLSERSVDKNEYAALNCIASILFSEKQTIGFLIQFDPNGYHKEYVCPIDDEDYRKANLLTLDYEQKEPVLKMLPRLDAYKTN